MSWIMRILSAIAGVFPEFTVPYTPKNMVTFTDGGLLIEHHHIGVAVLGPAMARRWRCPQD